jgi:hypothetical protein
MKELMIHVERIVRPVRATQRRKLRMRQELLGHLEAAFREERERGIDATAALEAAKRRLGDPGKVTRELQQSAPLVERILLAKLPVPKVLDRWEQRRLHNPGRASLNSWRGAICMTIAFIFVWLACGVSAPVSSSHARAFFMMENENRARFLAIFVGLWAAAGAALPMLCMRFVERAAGDKAGAGRILCDAGLLLSVQMGWTLLVFTQIEGRPPSVFEIVRALFAGSMALVIISMMARRVARLQHPYREWMMLDIST